MHARRERPRPTSSELEILEILWRIGPSTVRQVHTELQSARARGVGYTTVLKLMQIMSEKGWLQRDVSRRSHVYRPAESPEKTQRKLVRDFIDDVFAGSAAQLVVRALDSRRASAAELAEIRDFIRELERVESGR